MTTALRVLLTPAWLLRTLGALLAIAVCVMAAVWQFHRTDDQLAVARAAQSQLTAYDIVVPRDADSLDIEWLGRNVEVQGDVVTGARSYVRARLSPDGEVGFLVVDGVRIADGRVVAVLQGWVPEPSAAPRLAGERIRVTGRLQPQENFYAGAPIEPDRPLLTITDAGLAEQWPVAPTPGYVTVTGAPAGEGIQPVTPLVGTDPDVPFPLQNAFYSLQWVIFAIIVVVIWARFLRDDIRAAQEHEAAVAAAPDRVSL